MLVTSVRLAFAILAVAAAVLPSAPVAARQGSIRIEYVAPKDAAHQPIYDALREKRVLERVRDSLQGLRLPRPLTLKIEGCNGDINASYEFLRHHAHGLLRVPRLHRGTRAGDFACGREGGPHARQLRGRPLP